MAKKRWSGRESHQEILVDVEGEDPTYNLRTYWGLERVVTVESYTQKGTWLQGKAFAFSHGGALFRFF